MLTVYSETRPCCSRLSTRRDFIRVGTLGLGGWTLADLLQHKAIAADDASYVKDKSVVLLFLSGGASHIETFNPNMGAPSPYCSVTGEVATVVPGMSFGGTFPQLSRQAHRFAVVRSFQHSVSGHAQAINHVLAGGTSADGKGPTGFSMGSAFARLRGVNHPVTGMPTYTLLNSDEIDPQYIKEKPRVISGSRPNSLGAVYGPFTPGGESDAIRNMEMNIANDRLDDRLELLATLDRFKQQVDLVEQMQAVDKHTRQAFDLILGSSASAFDLSREDPRWVERYDTSRFRVGFRSFRNSQLGRHMLTARRLIEAGCGFVTVHSAGWDLHADRNNPGIESGMEMLGRPVDHAVSAFLEDLEHRGMSDEVLLIITGDFGRTPGINNRGGRDHWPKLCTLALAGGGVPSGSIIGKSARKNDEPVSEPITPSHLFATVMHTMFDIGQVRVTRGVPQPLMRLIDAADPIPGVV